MFALDIAIDETLGYIGLSDDQVRDIRIFGDHLFEVG